ncbi:MAG: flavodoxin family protein [Phycisphaerales bacterium JB037]
MTSIAIVYHSGFGHTKAVAASVLTGVESAGAVGTLIDVAELPAPDDDRNYAGRWSELEAADAIIFGTPTYMGTVSAAFKQFMDHTGTIWYRQAWKDKVAAGFTNAASLDGDKRATLVTLTTFAAQHQMIWVTQGVFPDREGANRLGSWLGLTTQADNNKGPDLAPPPEDHRTARMFGERVANAAKRWQRGRA